MASTVSPPPAKMREQFVKTKLCPYHARGNCINGTQCSYAHAQRELRPLPDLQNTKLCESVTKGFRCHNPSCTYAHCRDDLRAPGDLVAYKTALCFFFKKDRCLNGDKCRFAHGPEELRPKDEEHRQRRDFGCQLAASSRTFARTSPRKSSCSIRRKESESEDDASGAEDTASAPFSLSGVTPRTDSSDRLDFSCSTSGCDVQLKSCASHLASSASSDWGGTVGAEPFCSRPTDCRKSSLPLESLVADCQLFPRSFFSNEMIGGAHVEFADSSVAAESQILAAAHWSPFCNGEFCCDGVKGSSQFTGNDDGSTTGSSTPVPADSSPLVITAQFSRRISCDELKAAEPFRYDD